MRAFYKNLSTFMWKHIWQFLYLDLKWLLKSVMPVLYVKLYVSFLYKHSFKILVFLLLVLEFYQLTFMFISPRHRLFSHHLLKTSIELSLIKFIIHCSNLSPPLTSKNVRYTGFNVEPIYLSGIFSFHCLKIQTSTGLSLT
jgi:hypothetical protein